MIALHLTAVTLTACTKICEICTIFPIHGAAGDTARTDKGINMNIKERALLQNESGILRKSGIYFHTVSAFAQQNLFYPLWGAEYTCTEPYRVIQKNLNIYLIFSVTKGTLYAEYRGEQLKAEPGDLLLLNCMYPHEYYVKDETVFSWFYFNGAASSAYCDFLYQNQGAVFRNHAQAGAQTVKILHMLSKGSVPDDLFSIEIHRLLGILNTVGQDSLRLSPQIAAARNWMEAHFSEDISIAQAANEANMSRSYFTRRFRAETGQTPQDFLLAARIAHAKTRLYESDDSIEQIAFDCAFCSSSNFIRAFRENTGMTPLQFRKTVNPSIH